MIKTMINIKTLSYFHLKIRFKYPETHKNKNIRVFNCGILISRKYFDENDAGRIIKFRGTAQTLRDVLFLFYASNNRKLNLRESKLSRANYNYEESLNLSSIVGNPLSVINLVLFDKWKRFLMES